MTTWRYVSYVYILTLSVAFFVALMPTVHAETVAALPEVYVTDVTLDDYVVEPGQTVSGSAVFVNPGNVGASGVMYDVRVVGAYDDVGIPAEIYGSTSFGPVFVPASDEQEVSFTITLPEVIADENAGIEVQTYLESGAPLGWGDVDILVPDAFRVLTVIDGFVSVTASDETADPIRYELNQGPTVHEGMTATLGVDVLSALQKDTEIAPVIAVSELGAGVATMPRMVYPSTFTLPAGDTISQEFALPVADLAPGVYVGTLTLSSPDGELAIGDIQFKYIIAGEFANIQSVASDKDSLTVGEVATVTVTFTGVPFDINGAGPSPEKAALLDALFDNPPEDPEAFAQELARIEDEVDTVPPAQESLALGTGTLLVTLFNERDEQVAFGEQSVDLDTDLSAVLALEAQRTAKALRAEVRIMRGEEQLAFANILLSATYSELHEAASEGFDNNTLIIGALLLLGVIALALFLQYKKRGGGTNTTNTPSANGTSTLVVLFGFFVSGVIVFGTPFDISAYTVTDNCWQECRGYAPRVYLNTPALEVNPGEVFNIQGTVTAYQCTNSPRHYVIVYGRNNGGDWKVISRTNRNSASNAVGSISRIGTFGWRGKVYGTNNRFTVGSFTAPQDPGVYTVEVWSYYNWTGNSGVVEARGVKGFQNYYVAGSTGDPDLTATAPEVYSGFLASGKTITFSGVVQNIGENFAFGTITNNFEIDIDNDGTWDTTLTGTTLTSLNAGDETPVTSSNWSAIEGTHAARLCTDTNNTIGESNESNNCSGSSFVFTVIPTPQCSDGIDNDSDGTIDYTGVSCFRWWTYQWCSIYPDPDCTSENDVTEQGPQCSDGIDNDGNGLVDLDDPGCTNADDNLEYTSLVEPELSLTATPRVVRPEGTVTLQWGAEGVEEDSCTLSGSNGDSWNVGSSGSQESSAIETETVFTLSCTSLEGGAIIIDTSVRIVPKFEEQ